MEEFQLIRTMGIQYQIHYFEIELEKQQSEENLIIQSIEINGWLHPTSFISFHFIQKYKLQPIMKKKTNTQICAHQLFKEKALKKLEIQNNQLEPDESSDGSDDSVEIEKKQENQFHSESSKSSFSLEIQEKQSDSDGIDKIPQKRKRGRPPKSDIIKKKKTRQTSYKKMRYTNNQKKQYRFLLIILDDPDYFQKKKNIGFKHVIALIIQHFSQFFAVMHQTRILGDKTLSLLRQTRLILQKPKLIYIYQRFRRFLQYKVYNQIIKYKVCVQAQFSNKQKIS
ncbi:hypothetical protein pb186bvf_015933 [Paramecium bursaria]